MALFVVVDRAATRVRISSSRAYPYLPGQAVLPVSRCPKIVGNVTLVPAAYFDVLPPEVRARVSVEAAVAQTWHKFVGDDGECVSIEHFGASADYKTLFQQFGFTTEHVVEAGRRSLARAAERSV